MTVPPTTPILTDNYMPSVEEWKEVRGFPGYEVSSHGNIRRKTGDRYSPMAVWGHSTGFLRTKLRRVTPDGKSECVERLPHILVMKAFRPIPMRCQIRHTDGNTQNNSLDNLEWLYDRTLNDLSPDYPGETWCPVPSFPGYTASSRGRLKSDRDEDKGFVRVALESVGYQVVTVFDTKRGATRCVKSHVMICEAFHGCRSGPVCRHLNGDRLDNRPSNLRWGTSQENSHDSVRHGSMPMGDNSSRSKLTSTDVCEIVWLLNTSSLTCNQLAHYFDVSPSAIRSIKSGRCWQHLTHVKPKRSPQETRSEVRGDRPGSAEVPVGVC